MGAFVAGPKHPDTLNCMGCMAVLFHAQGKRGEAIVLLREVLEGQRATLGPAHPSTLNTKANLAAVLRTEGEM